MQLLSIMGVKSLDCVRTNPKHNVVAFSLINRTLTGDGVTDELNISLHCETPELMQAIANALAPVVAMPEAPTPATAETELEPVA